jgi:hypothetical protein
MKTQWNRREGFMACDCDVEDTKTVSFTRTLPGAPPQNIGISVTIKSGCKIPEDAPDDTGRIYLPEARLFRSSVRLKQVSQLNVRQVNDIGLRKPHENDQYDQGEKPKDDGGGNCLTSYIVSLDAVSTPGLKIIEVRFGPDTFAVDIPVGGFEIFSAVCDEACVPARTGSVKILDPFGNFLAELKRIRICECGSFG